MITIKINGIDRTDSIAFNGSFRIQDNINQQRDTLNFEVLKSPTKTWYPQISDEVIVEYGASDVERIFGGVITSVERSVESVNLAIFNCETSDWAFLMDRKLVIERYNNETISDIISDILTKYAPSFTMTNVIGTDTIKTIAFNSIKISECLEKMAQLTGYSWYVDSYKDIHFFPKNQEPASFNLTDTSGNYIWKSLVITDDFSQIRNSILVKGGEIEGNEVTEAFTQTGTEDERKLCKTAHKFAKLPTVKINGGADLNGGVEFINSDADFDFLWDYNQKYVRFTAGNIPVDNDVVTITGIPTYRLIGRVNNSESIREYGVYEYKIDDANIKSDVDMKTRAQSELNAYKNGIIEGQFQTYEAGLRSGQVINVNSPLRGVNEDFLIQSVSFSAITPDGDGIWDVKLATLKTVGIIEFLQKMLRNNGVTEGVNDLLLSFYDFTDSAEASDSISTPVVTAPPYTWEDNPPTPQANPIVWNFFTWV